MNDDLDLLELDDFETEDDIETLSPLKNGNDLNEIYPEANIKVEREQYPIFQLKRKYDRDLIILDPDFQRADVWKKNQKSELIESVLMGIPLPIFYLNETKEGKLVVVDGRQRLTTFFSYLDNEFKLSKLRILYYLNGLEFSELDEKLQANLEDFQLITQVIKPPTPDRIKFDIFDRVNRGGTSLNNQEMRNALYQGKSTILLKELSNSKQFKKATNNSINSTRMKDKYLILRTLSFYLWKNDKLIDANGDLIEYKKDIDEFLGRSMECINSLDDKEIDNLKKIFYKTMENNNIIFEANAFRRLSYSDKRNPINMILYESFSYLFIHFTQDECLRHKYKIKKLSNEFLNNNILNRLLTQDRGRGIVIPEVFKLIDDLKKEITNDIKN